MRDSFSAYNVIASFEDMAGARHAIGALEDKGVEAADISLLGRGAEAAQAQTETAARDEQLMDKGMHSFLGGVAAGTAAGGVAGFLAGLAAFGVPGLGPVVAGGIWATTLGGAAAGGGVGSAVGGYAKIKQSEAWELASRGVGEGRGIVGVHSDDQGAVLAAAEILGAQRPASMNYFDDQGRRIHLQ